jgi:gamma-glutamyl hercynylcysteine S-oxide synthase
MWPSITLQVSGPRSQTPLRLPEANLHAFYRELLSDTRERTLGLVERIAEEDLDRQHSPIMSPVCWDLGHIAAFEDLWLCQNVGGYEALEPDLAVIYDASATPRSVRSSVKALEAAQAIEFMHRVRERSLETLERVSLTDPTDRLNYCGFVWEMLVQHEQQHSETILQTLKLADPGVYVPPRQPVPTVAEPDNDEQMVRVEAGPVWIGVDSSGFAYDNERPAHIVDLGAFLIDRTPVSNAEFSEFVASGGYQQPKWWSEAGWEWRQANAIERPLYWFEDGSERDFERQQPIDPNLPVAHVSWYEADAYARWRGKRLPTEIEWEKAASWDPASDEKRCFPWGDQPPTSQLANLDQQHFGQAGCGAYPQGASPTGVLGMVGDLWEWTQSEFRGYPGFRAWPYREYSEVFFSLDYKVLRGGSWATQGRAIRSTFRNWDLPQRRQLFAGFRLASDG